MIEETLVNNVIKVFGLSALTFFVGILFTPILTHFLYKHKMWKQKARTQALGGGESVIFNELHKEKEVGTPRMGGVLIWGSVVIVAVLFFLLSFFIPSPFAQKLNFLSRNQTWLPFFTLIFGAIIGFIDDFLQIKGRGNYMAGGISLTKRIFMVSLIGFLGAWWFYYKLEVDSLHIPFYGDIFLGWLFIPFFVLVNLGVWSGGVIDGLDGLAGGVFASIFAAYAGIAFYQNQIDLSTFSAIIVGGILAFLWFNIPPARFYMGETGILGLTVCLTVLAFLTNAVLVLPIIAFPLVAESLSDIIQITSKKLLKRKVFLVAPIHHHFEALGWPAYKITMRFWVIGFIFALIGMIIALTG